MPTRIVSWRDRWLRCSNALVLLLWLILAQASPSWGAISPHLHLKPMLHHLVLDRQQPDSAWEGSDSTLALLRSERTALNYSLLGTLIPLPTIVFTVPGLIAGPSLGYFYANMPGRGWTGMGIRTLALGGMISSFAICGWDCGEGDAAYNVAWVVFLSSGGVLVGSAIYDIATVERAVRRHNALVRESSWVVSPHYFAESRALGLQFRVAW